MFWRKKKPTLTGKEVTDTDPLRYALGHYEKYSNLVTLVQGKSGSEPSPPAVLHRWANPVHGIETLQGVIITELTRFFRTLGTRPFVVSAPEGRYYRMTPAKGLVEVFDVPKDTGVIFIFVYLY